MNFVNNIYFTFTLNWSKPDPLPDFADIIYTGIGCGINFDDIDKSAFVNGLAIITFAARFTLKWLKEHLETEASVQEITDTLTMIGLELESVEDRAAELAAFKVAYVKEARPHPNADRLSGCIVAPVEEEVQRVGRRPHALTRVTRRVGRCQECVGLFVRVNGRDFLVHNGLSPVHAYNER